MFFFIRPEDIDSISSSDAAPSLKGMYCSFKYGGFEGERDGRYYVDLAKSSIGKFMEGHLTIKESFVTFDSLGRGGKWLNLIVSKQGQFA